LCWSFRDILRLTIGMGSSFHHYTKSGSSKTPPFKVLSPINEAKSLEVRPFSTSEEYEGMVDYFLGADDSFLEGMGVARSLLPARDAWLRAVLADHQLPDQEKDRLYVGWFYQGRQIGHSSVNRIRFGEDAFFHLHLWRPELRKAGFGMDLCRQSISIYFDRLQLKTLWSEPYAENPAPNRTLVKLGFEFVKRYRTVPGATAFEQDVNLYRKRKT
jgi:RimJ/RimL family protein N-acetyltransferase